MFWNCKRKCTKTILIVLPNDFGGQCKYLRAISKYVEEHHMDDIRKGRIMHETLYSNSMVTEEIQLYGDCELDIFELNRYIAGYAKSTDTIMKGE